MILAQLPDPLVSQPRCQASVGLHPPSLKADNTNTACSGVQLSRYGQASTAAFSNYDHLWQCNRLGTTYYSPYRMVAEGEGRGQRGKRREAYSCEGEVMGVHPRTS